MSEDREKRRGSREFLPFGCEEASRLYVAREMGEEEVSSFEAHLTGCGRCRELVGEWKKLFSVLSGCVHIEPRPEFDAPVMAFVEGLVGRRDALVVNRQLAWVGGLSLAAIVVALVATLREGVALPSLAGRYVVAGTTWVVDAFGRGTEWFVFYLTNTLKLGEILVEVSQKLDPIWNSLRLAAGHVDVRLVALEIVLFMLSLFLLRGLVGTAQKGRCTNVGIIA